MAIFRKFAGSGFVVLNVLRTLNIIVLIMAAIAAIVMLIKTFVLNKVSPAIGPIPDTNSTSSINQLTSSSTTKFFFFDAVSHIITTIIALFLLTSELPLPFLRPYFARHWPHLSSEHGLTFLGASIIVLGISTLGDLNRDANSEENIGTPFWRVIASAGVLGCIIGLANILLSFIYRDRDNGVTARMLRAHGATDARVRSSADKSYPYPPASSSRGSPKPGVSRGASVRTYQQRVPIPVVTDDAGTRRSRFFNRFSMRHGPDVSPVSPMSIPPMPAMPHPAYARDEEAQRDRDAERRPYSPTSVYGGHGNPYR